MTPDVSKTSIDKMSTDHLGYAKGCASGKLKEVVLSYIFSARRESSTTRAQRR